MNSHRLFLKNHIPDIVDFVECFNNYFSNIRMFIIICVHHIHLRYPRSIALIIVKKLSTITSGKIITFTVNIVPD